MTTIEFRPNEPEILSLKDTSGCVDGFQVHYETSDGRMLSLPRPAALQLGKLDPAPGEELSVCKYRKPGEPAEWVVSLTPRSETARANREAATMAEATRQDLAAQLQKSIHCSDCKVAAGGQHKLSCHRQGLVTSESDYRDETHPRPVRQMPKAGNPPANLPPDTPKGTGTYGPLPQVALAGRKTRNWDPVPFNLAFREVVAFVTKELNASGEQWSEESRQDLVATVLISGAKAGWISQWEREAAR